MQEVMYVGNLKICKVPKFGVFVKNKRYDLDEPVAREILKIKDFVVPYFLARYIGPDAHRKIMHREKVIICPKGLWVKLPILVRYKINADPQFQVGPDGTSSEVNRILVSQEQKKVVVSKLKMKHRAPQIQMPVAKPKKEEKPEQGTEKRALSIEEMDLPKKLEKILTEAGLKEIPNVRELLKIKGIGPASLKLIKEKMKR